MNRSSTGTSQNIQIRDLNAARVYGLIEDTLSQSDLEWSPNDFEIVFMINRNSFRVGAGNQVKLANYFPAAMKKHKTTKDYEDEEGPLSCMAVALAYGMGDCNFNPITYRGTPDSVWLERARQIQNDLGWDQTTSIDQAQDFVDMYPDYRVVVFTPMNVAKPEVFTGESFDEEEIDTSVSLPPKMICLYLSPGVTKGHFVLVPNPIGLIRAKFSGSSRWCHKCCERFQESQDHPCTPHLKRRIPPQECTYCKGSHTKTECALFQCKTCQKRKTDSRHRCRVYSKNYDKKNFQNDAHLEPVFQIDGNQDGKKKALLVWDIECQLEESNNGELMQTFVEDAEGYYTDQTCNIIKVYRTHKPIMVCVADVYSPFKMTFKGPECIKQFLAFLKEYNKGKVVAIAHNSAKYDSRIVFNELLNSDDLKDCRPIARGSKIIQLSWDEVVFRDSFCHLPNALKVLAKSMNLDASLQKGYFPHLFNSMANYNYVGPIPEKKYFDLPFDPNGYPEFDEWYEQVKDQDWNLQYEMEKYCEQDVQVLKEIVKQFEQSTRAGLPLVISPWSYSTAPAFVHDLHVQTVNHMDEDSVEELSQEEKITILDAKAKTSTWAALLDEEYRFARKALRGGRTDVRKLYRKLSQEEIDQGIRIKYQDIVSMYPFQQVAEDYPVGVPTIYVFDESEIPCKHSYYMDCSCNEIDYRLQVVKVREPWTREQILSNPNFFGIICADVTAPMNMYHPILPVFNEETIKCTFPVGPIRGKQVFTSVEFKKALENGYTIDKLYRYDEYKKAAPLWDELVKKCYLEKMRNSRNAPEGQERQDMQEYYERVFDMPELKFETWQKNPVMKLVAKIMVNVGWGKHAQNMDLETIHILDGNEDDEKELSKFKTIMDENLQGKSTLNMSFIGNYQVLKQKRKKVNDARTNYSSLYLPAAIFVPAYGRLQLWEQMNKLGQRVLYHDTDSIIYEYIPGEYNIPEGDYWGQWEVDDKDQGIIEFVGLAPKSYGIRNIKKPNGSPGYEMIKFKGLSISRKHSKQINFDVMVDMILNWQRTGESIKKLITQSNWNYNFGKDIVTIPGLKEFGFDSENLKGPVSRVNLCQYPPGYILQE
jgi:hypothetical protein